MFQNNKRKILLVVSLICIIGLVGIGMSYAYWRFVYTQTDKNVAISKCLKLEMTNESEAISLDNMYPISDEAGRSLKPYTFTLTNTCSMSAEYKVNLEMLEGTTLNSKYLATLVNNGNIKLLNSFDETKTTISGSTESRTLDTNVLTPGASKEYSISLWMDKSVTLADDAENKSFAAKVVIDASMYTGIVDKIVAQLDTTSKCPTVNDDGTVNITSAESENSLLCSAPDNYGTSYYYRGNVTNNYVKFAGFYWRILRINGDGSIRVIYDGTAAHTNGEASEDRIIGTSAFNENNNDNAYIGYMYGTPGSSTYAETHANINDSTIKKYIDLWYESNLKNTNYERYLVDNSFCNDRNISGFVPDGYSNAGYNSEKTAYKWYGYTAIPKNVSLLCLQRNDNFSINYVGFGNGKLNYPIATLSSEEAAVAGGFSVQNKSFFLYTGNYYWTLSTFEFNGSVKSRVVNPYGNILDWGGTEDTKVGVRPVVSIKATSLKSGDGTINNAYTVE